MRGELFWKKVPLALPSKNLKKKKQGVRRNDSERWALVQGFGSSLFQKACRTRTASSSRSAEREILLSFQAPEGGECRACPTEGETTSGVSPFYPNNIHINHKLTDWHLTKHARYGKIRAYRIRVTAGVGMRCEPFSMKGGEDMLNKKRSLSTVLLAEVVLTAK